MATVLSAVFLQLVVSWSREDFGALAQLRAARRGTSFWHGSGTLVALAAGRVVAHVDVLEVCRTDLSRSNDTSSTLLVRKLFVYRDPASGEVLEHRGALAILATPCQEVTVTLREDEGTLDIGARTSASQPALSASSANGGMRRSSADRFVELNVPLPASASARAAAAAAARRESPIGLRVRAPLGLTFQTGGAAPPPPAAGARTREVESYVYWREPLTRRVKRAYTRVGAGPAWSTPGSHMLQLRSARTRWFHGIPRHMRAFVREELPAWRRAPAALDAEGGS